MFFIMYFILLSRQFCYLLLVLRGKFNSKKHDHGNKNKTAFCFNYTKCSVSSNTRRKEKTMLIFNYHHKCNLQRQLITRTELVRLLSSVVNVCCTSVNVLRFIQRLLPNLSCVLLPVQVALLEIMLKQYCLSERVINHEADKSSGHC